MSAPATLTSLPIAIPDAEIAALCRHSRVRRLALFGSVLCDAFTADSDLDVLVEFEPGHTPGLAFYALEEELERLFGRSVDLNTPGSLSRYFRDRVVAEAETIYEQETAEG